MVQKVLVGKNATKRRSTGMDLSLEPPAEGAHGVVIVGVTPIPGVKSFLYEEPQDIS